MSELRELGSESLARKVSELREVKRVEGSGLIAGHESSVKKESRVPCCFAIYKGAIR